MSSNGVQLPTNSIPTVIKQLFRSGFREVSPANGTCNPMGPFSRLVPMDWFQLWTGRQAATQTISGYVRLQAFTGYEIF
jgi:hypothetical protein